MCCGSEMAYSCDLLIFTLMKYCYITKNPDTQNILFSYMSKFIFLQNTVKIRYYTSPWFLFLSGVQLDFSTFLSLFSP